MITFETVYGFNVLEEIKGGRQIQVVDKLQGTVMCANVMTVEKLLKILYNEKEKNRYDFYFKKERNG